MPTVINPKITDAGMAAAVAASNDGLQLKITHVALGTGQYTPAENATALFVRKEKVAVSGASSAGPGAFAVSVYLPSYTAGAPYNVGEIGFYAGDPDAGGVLFAVHSAPGATIFQRNTIDWVGQFAMKVTRVPAGSVTIEVDPGGALSLAIMAQHLGNTHPHTQYIRHFASAAPLPTADEGPIWHAGFNSLMTWQVFTANGANYVGYASVDIGLLRPDTQPTPRDAWVKTGVTGLPTTMTLYHWAKHNGLVMTAGWMPGTLFYKDNLDGTFATPDVRGEHIRMWDELRGVDIGRQFGSHQKGSLLVGDNSANNEVIYAARANTEREQLGWDAPVDQTYTALLRFLQTSGADLGQSDNVSHMGVARGRNTSFAGVIHI